jgi:hypothetical protein
MAKKPATRQERLAQALRENLKRRKAADRARAPKAAEAAQDGLKSAQNPTYNPR